MSRTVFTITWEDNVSGAERLRISRLWAATLSEKRGVADCRMQTFRTYRTGGDRARVDASNNRVAALGEATCSVCGQDAPLVQRGPKDEEQVVVREHYPKDVGDAFQPQPGFYCRGSGQPPREVAAA